MKITTIQPAAAADHPWIVSTARRLLGGEYQVHSRRQFNVTDAHVLIARREHRPAGFLTWDHDGTTTEILAIACATRRAGVGSRLIDAVHAEGAEAGSRRLCVVTTDTNHAAQHFYVRNNFQLIERRVGAVDECRRLYKPEIPSSMHDELVYARNIGPTDTGA